MAVCSTSTRLSDAVAGQYLPVLLDGELYGFPVTQVREIIRLQTITPVPQMPEFVNGVINLRGRAVPVVDLRLKVGAKAACNDRTCIVVLQVSRPDFDTHVKTTSLPGMAKVKGHVKMLLDIDRVIGDAEIPDRAIASVNQLSF